MGRLKDLNIRFDVVDTFSAASTFNVSNEDNMNLVAFLLPGSEFEVAPEENNAMNSRKGPPSFDTNRGTF